MKTVGRFGRIAGAAALCLVPSLAFATPQFSVFVGSGNNSGCAPGLAQSGASPLSDEMVCTTAIGTGAADANAGLGSIGASARVATVTGVTIPFSIGGSAFFADTLTFSKIDPDAPDTFSVSLNLGFSGLINAAAVDSAGARVDLLIGLFTAYSLSIIKQGDGSFEIQNPQGITGTAAIAADDIGFHTLLTTSAAQGSVGDVSFSMQLLASAGSRGINGSATADFSNTLEFPTGMDVFNLPDGYTVNAGDYLVNNRFIVAQAVPEPATLALFGLGLLGLVVARRRKA